MPKYKRKIRTQIPLKNGKWSTIISTFEFQNPPWWMFWKRPTIKQFVQHVNGKKVSNYKFNK